MKACKFCGTQVQNREKHCPSCGSSVFLNVCENCGTQFDSGFCPNCGVKAGQAKKVCPDCNTAYFSNACPNCGYMPSRKPAVQKVEQTVIHKHVYEKAPARTVFTPTKARKTKKKGNGCGCLTWIIVFLIIAALFGNSSSSRKTTTSSSSGTTVRTTFSVTGDPNASPAPTATPEPAVVHAQQVVDRYFEEMDEAEKEAVSQAASSLDRYKAKEAGKVLLVHRSWEADRGLLASAKSEPQYAGSLGYAAVNDDQSLEKNPSFETTPWQIPVYRKDRQFWEQAGTIDHKSEVVVIGQELEMPKRKYSTSSCSGYLHVIRLDTGEDCWLNVDNYVTAAYWDNSLTSAQESGYCIAAFKQVSDYYPVTRGNEKAELEDGTLVLLPMRSKIYGSSPDKTNNSIPGIVFKQNASYGGITVWFNVKDLTLTY